MTTTTLSVGQTVTVKVGPTKTGLFDSYTEGATNLGLTKYQEGSRPTTPTGTIVALGKHPGWSNDDERLFGMLFLGSETHPEEGKGLAGVEIDGKQYIFLSEDVTPV